MNVIEDTRNRVKSNAAGIGVGSRRSISNVVHRSLVWLGRLPRRANNWHGCEYCYTRSRVAELRVPDPSCPSSKTPSIALQT